MYRIGELAKMAEVTPDTIRYYEKQQMMEHEVRTEGGVSPVHRKRSPAIEIYPPCQTTWFQSGVDPRVAVDPYRS